jgi:SAM-dependent methyltransferase
MRLDTIFLGSIDRYEDGVAMGWALDRRCPGEAISVDLYVDGERLASTPANLPRPDLNRVSPVSRNKGFNVPIHRYVGNSLFPRIELYFGNSTDRVPASESAVRFINRPIINIRDLQSVGYPSCTPSPSSKVIKYISGKVASEDEQRRQYVWSGILGAADVYNLILDLGLDVRRPNFEIIDMGCGSGRYAAFLKQYMPSCKYLGVDVWEEGILWAQNALASKDPDLRFALLEGASGYVGDKAYRLPSKDGSAQLVIAMSLFTHLSPTASIKYFREVRRILAADGVGLLTFRLLDQATMTAADAAAMRAGLPMTKTPESWWYGNDGYLDIYYKDQFIRRMIQEAGLKLIAIRRGYWHRIGGDSSNPAAYQDMAIVRPG